MTTLALNDASLWALVAQTVGVFAVVAILTLWFASVAWVASDVRRRTTDATEQWLGVLAPVVLFIPGVVLYVAMRPPETLEEAQERRWEMEALALQAAATPTCRVCQRRLRDDFIRCPYCGFALGERCNTCDRFNPAEWVVCAYCGSAKKAPVTTRRAVPPNPEPAVAQPVIATHGRVAG
ncbi:MAG: zinc ribbon domain-containing protein [Chloroflexi bacterium]|nr:zinc ribbon domain-containing protein [Chloroflexota bacterium]